MSIEAPLGRVESLLDYLITADVVPNTFGTIWQIRDGLEQIDSGIVGNATGLGAETLDRLRRLLTTIEDNRSLFAIPEKYLIDNVYKAVERIRKKVGT